MNLKRVRTGETVWEENRNGTWGRSVTVIVSGEKTGRGFMLRTQMDGTV